MPVLNTNGSQRYAGVAALNGQPLTIELWYYARASVATQQYLVHINNAAATSYWTFLQIVGSQLQFFVAGATARTGSTTLVNGKWYHIVCTYSGSGTSAGVKFYVNGVEESYTDAAAFTALPDHTGPISVGGRNYDAARVIVDGLVHKVRVYKRVLTSGEAAARYANPTSVDYVSTYASDLIFRADYDADVNGNGSAPASTSGTLALTSRAPLDLPGVAWFNNTDNTGSADSAGIANTITSSRFATMANFAATGANAAETSTSGPKQNRNVNLKIGVAHASHSSGAAAYVSAATGSGPTWDNRKITVFGWIAPVAARRAPAETILHLGDPATASSAVLELSQTYSYLQISRAGGATEVGASDIPMQTTLPRFFAVRCTASERTIMVDSIRKNLGSAFTSATSTGLRIGAPLGGTSDPFVGDLYKLCIAQRALSDAELDALLTYGEDVYHYTTPEFAIVAEGSSTMWGTSDSSANNEGILSQIKQQHPEAYIVNHANATENVAHFDNGYAAGVGATVSALKTAYSWADEDFLGILQVYGNDFDSTGATTLEERYSTDTFNYVSVYNKWVTDIGTIAIMWPVVRTDYASESLSVDREADVLAFLALTSNDYPAFEYLTRPALLTPSDGTFASLGVVAGNPSLGTGGTYYIGDYTHLLPAGMRLYETQLLNLIDGFLNPGGPASKAIAIGII